METMFSKIHKFFLHSEWKLSLWDMLPRASIFMTSFVVPAWATYYVSLFQDYSPLSWVIAGFLGMLAWSTIKLIMALAAKWQSNKILADKYVEHKHTINPLDDVFTKKKIDVSDFFSPIGESVSNKTFKKCEIHGIGAIALIDGNAITGNSRLHSCNLVEIPNGTMKSGPEVAFYDSQFIDCKFYFLTIYLDPEIIKGFEGKDFSVISKSSFLESQ